MEKKNKKQDRHIKTRQNGRRVIKESKVDIVNQSRRQGMDKQKRVNGGGKGRRSHRKRIERGEK